MKDLENSKHTVIGLDTHSKRLSVKSQQNSLINLKNKNNSNSVILEKLAELDPNQLSPMEALRELAKLRKLLDQERNIKSSE